jgi:ATP phosphoribosyltransferase regulatory subunit HisZ
MKTKRKRRSGATETVGVSLDAQTKRELKALAREKHQGNVSALITEMTKDAIRQAAFERAWRLYGGPDPTDEARAKVDAELEAGWALARKHSGKKLKRRTAA